MPLTQERLNEVVKRLRAALINRHPNWENYVRAIEKYAAEKVVDNPPAPVPRDFDINQLTAAQRTALKNRIKAIVGGADAASVDEVLP